MLSPAPLPVLHAGPPLPVDTPGTMALDQFDPEWGKSVFAILYVCSPSRPFLGWEHPADPAMWAPPGSHLQHCASVWHFPEFQRFMKAINAKQADFDQGVLGHPKRKPTSMMATSWYVYEHLHALRGAGTGESPAQVRKKAGPSM